VWDRINIFQSLSKEFIQSIMKKNDNLKSDNFFKNSIKLRKKEFSLETIKKFKPCKEGIERYLEVFGPDEVITWNNFVSRHKKESDIYWLYGKI